MNINVYSIRDFVHKKDSENVLERFKLLNIHLFFSYFLSLNSFNFYLIVLIFLIFKEFVKQSNLSENIPLEQRTMWPSLLIPNKGKCHNRPQAAIPPGKPHKTESSFCFPPFQIFETILLHRWGMFCFNML